MIASEFVLRVVVATVLGAAIGLERQWRQRMAGLRTSALVATGAALFVSVSVLIRSCQATRQAAEWMIRSANGEPAVSLP